MYFIVNTVMKENKNEIILYLLNCSNSPHARTRSMQSIKNNFYMSIYANIQSKYILVQGVLGEKVL
jgi:hypothetical protein